jgi:2-C-methyl-D-erythritol 2,4-cyclodiphosphate synthase
MFRYGLLRKALAQIDDDLATDEAAAVEALGLSPKLVPGNTSNFKVTFPDDLAIAAAILDKRSSMRIGQGFDVHAFAEGRKLIIGGVEIPYERGLLGHSDADVLLHAICDALLGAAALGDIGKHFPDTDPRYRGADSRSLLRHVAALVREQGYRVANVDATIVAQAPKMAPHIVSMVANIAADLGIAANSVNVKATTTERLGFTGRGEGIAAQAICLLAQR